MPSFSFRERLCLLATGRVGGYKRRAQLVGKTSGATRLLQNVAIEDIEKRRSKIDYPSLSDLAHARLPPLTRTLQ